MADSSGSFGSGFADALAGGIQSAQANKLQMMMLSKRIEMEQAAKQGEMQFAQQLQQIPSNELQEIGNKGSQTFKAIMSGQPDQIPSIDWSKINSPSGQQAALKLQDLQNTGMARFGMGMLTPVMGVNAQGQQTVTPFNRRTGQAGIPQATGAMSPSAAKEVADARSQFGQMDLNLQDVQKQVSGFIQAATAGQLPGQYANLKLNQIVQNDPIAKAYFDALPNLSARYEKMLTNNRVPEYLIQSGTSAFPSLTDTVPTAMQKIRNLRVPFLNAKVSMLQAHGLPPDPQDAQYLQQYSSGGVSQPSGQLGAGGAVQALKQKYGLQ